MRETHTLNLAPLFVVWSAIFVLAAVLNDNLSLLWWAAVPWLIIFGFAVLMMLVVFIVIGIKYWQGYPIYLTTPRKGERVVRRSRADVRYSRTRYSIKFGK